MQFYLLPYIWCIFLMATIPIINFRGIVHTKTNICSSELSDNSEFSIVYTVYSTQYNEHLFTNMCSLVAALRQLSSAEARQIPIRAKKLRLRELQGSCTCTAAGAAKHLRKSCRWQLRSASFAAQRKKLQMRALRSRNLTLKVKFFQESCNKNKKNFNKI